MTKDKWRRTMRERLKNMSFDMFKQKCTSIYAKLYQETIWKQACTIGITVSILQEVDTRPIIQHAWERGKCVAVPRTNPQLHSLEFYAIQSFSQLEKGYAGIMEPHPKRAEKINDEMIELLFVPGIVFDKQGYRIGYGGGYFDRYLKQFNYETISLLFACQLVDSIPRELYDLPVKRMITEDEVIEVQQRGMS